ncbi:hypothetical protein F5Y07DRAFT_398578 [Xylaria sp. FL0933]|nr:hypothetical protein F5Y07DRAFT_398578 [Xylaria sp. FL0933]
MVTFKKPPSVGESIVWTPPMAIGNGGKHDAALLSRLTRDRREVGRGTFDDPKVIWVARPADYGCAQIEKIVQEETKACGQAYAWIMMGVHEQSTVTAFYNGAQTVREMADDDSHVTIRMGREASKCTLHGHLYLHMEGPPPLAGQVDKRIATRLMTADERSYVGGQPRHLWIWGPYSRECPAYPRSNITLPEPPFVKKPGR